MVFVYVPRRRDVFAPTLEEERAVARLRAKGLAGDELAAALAGEGVEPGRARQLAGLRTFRASGSSSLGAGPLVLAVFVALAVGLGKQPLREWFRRELPGWEWLAGLIVPLTFLLFFAWRFAARRRRAEDEISGGPTRAGRIDNRPIE
jgi:hypothetical protein